MKYEIITETKYSKYNSLISKWEWVYKTVVTKYNETLKNDEDLSPEVTCPECKAMLSLDSLEDLYYSQKRESFICEDCEGAFHDLQEGHLRTYGEPYPYKL